MGSDVIVCQMRTFAELWAFDNFVEDENVRRNFANDIPRFVAFDGEEILGFIELTRGTGPARHAGTIRLHVGAAQRNRGVGTAMLVTMLEYADLVKTKRLVATPYLPADGSGARKVAFFNRHGFVMEGIAHQFALDGDEFVDAAMMARVRA